LQLKVETIKTTTNMQSIAIKRMSSTDPLSIQPSAPTHMI